jgi:predicted alpha/beta superfamily hydrolase
MNHQLKTTKYDRSYETSARQPAMRQSAPNSALLLACIAVLSLSLTGTSHAQDPSILLNDGDKVLFVGNSKIGSEGGLNNHLRRTVANVNPPLAIQADWLAMYDKPTLKDMYTDELVERIRTGDDKLVIVSSGSDEAMRSFADLIKDSQKQMALFATWADNPLMDPEGMAGFRSKTQAKVDQARRFQTETGIPVIPSGLIYYDLLVDPVPFDGLRHDYLFVPESSVQNDLGTLANVSAVYAVTTGRSPVGLPFWNPFSDELVRAVQQRVWQIVQDWKAGKAVVKQFPPDIETPAWPALLKDGDHIFYIGNSFIGTEGGLENHFPRITTCMQPPLHVQTKSLIFWGQGLNRMYTDEVLQEIRTGDNDLVVVTSGSPDQLRKFYDAIAEAGSKMMVHMTWGRNPAISGADLASFREQTQRIVDRMKEFEKDTGVPVAPCGLVFYDLTVDPPAVPGLRLDWVFMVENIHQNHIGTMANAATHYAVMTGRSPVGLPMWDPYPPELVKAVQERAWKIVQDWKADKTVVKPLPSENPAPERRRRRQRREITWVNPDIKDMPGLTHHILQSKALGHDVGYVVWTPPNYSQTADKRYPVIYFLHGAGGNEAADSAGFSSWAEKAIADGSLPPVLCVFPNGGMSGYRGEVEDMIIEELIPTIDKDYRTIAQPHARALAGFSMGGAGSVYLSIMHPQLFCAAGSMGGGLRGGSEDITAAIERALPVWKKSNFGFFFVNGDDDRPTAFESFSATLNENGIENEVLILPDTPHNLGLYYERSVAKLLTFIGNHLK